LLAHYADKTLIDPYDVYQHLMEYWAATMQDDVYQIAADGWKGEKSRVIDKDQKGKEKDKGWTCDLIPKPRIVARYFAEEQSEIDNLAGKVERVSAQISELEDEHAGEGGAFADFEKVNKKAVAARLKEIAGDKNLKDDVAVLKDWVKLSDEASKFSTQLDQAEAALDAEAYAKYPELTEPEIKSMVVDCKWMAVLESDIHGEMDRISQEITHRVKELGERYEYRLRTLVERSLGYATKVDSHLARMGFRCV